LKPFLFLTIYDMNTITPLGNINFTFRLMRFRVTINVNKGKITSTSPASPLCNNQSTCTVEVNVGGSIIINTQPDRVGDEVRKIVVMVNGHIIDLLEFPNANNFYELEILCSLVKSLGLKDDDEFTVDFDYEICDNTIEVFIHPINAVICTSSNCNPSAIDVARPFGAGLIICEEEVEVGWDNLNPHFSYSNYVSDIGDIKTLPTNLPVNPNGVSGRIKFIPSEYLTEGKNGAIIFRFTRKKQPITIIINSGNPSCGAISFTVNGISRTSGVQFEVDSGTCINIVVTPHNCCELVSVSGVNGIAQSNIISNLCILEPASITFTYKMKLFTLFVEHQYPTPPSVCSSGNTHSSSTHSGSGNYIVNCCEAITVIANPSTCCEVDSWILTDGTSIYDNGSGTTAAIPSNVICDKNLTLRFIYKAKGPFTIEVIHNPEKCCSTCSVNSHSGMVSGVLCNSNQTITANPGDCCDYTGYELISGTANHSAISQGVILTNITSNIKIKFNYTTKTHTVKVIHIEDDCCSGSTDNAPSTINCGENLTVTATPGTDCKNPTWVATIVGSSNVSGSGNVASLSNIRGNIVITFTWEADCEDECDLTVTSSGEPCGGLIISVGEIRYKVTASIIGCVNIKLTEQIVNYGESISISALIPNADSSPNCCCEVYRYRVNGGSWINGTLANTSNIQSDINIEFDTRVKTYTLHFIIEGSCENNTILHYGNEIQPSGPSIISGGSVSINCDITRFRINRQNATPYTNNVEILVNGKLVRTLSASSGDYSGFIIPCQDNIIKLVCPEATQLCSITLWLQNNTNNNDNGDIFEVILYSVLDLPIILPIPTRSGYVFDGWFSDLGLTVFAGTKVNSISPCDRHYWAKWEVVKHTITVDRDICIHNNTPDSCTDVFIQITNSEFNINIQQNVPFQNMTTYNNIPHGSTVRIYGNLKSSNCCIPNNNQKTISMYGFGISFTSGFINDFDYSRTVLSDVNIKIRANINI